MSLNFVKKKENFKCSVCNQKVIGTGYTNHCPNCLWSKHVDIFPGDRKEKCKGLMQPIEIEHKGKDILIVHKCTKCGATKKCTSTPNDRILEFLEDSFKP